MYANLLIKQNHFFKWKDLPLCAASLNVHILLTGNIFADMWMEYSFVLPAGNVSVNGFCVDMPREAFVGLIFSTLLVTRVDPIWAAWSWHAGSQNKWNKKRVTHHISWMKKKQVSLASRENFVHDCSYTSSCVSKSTHLHSLHQRTVIVDSLQFVCLLQIFFFPACFNHASASISI